MLKLTDDAVSMIDHLVHDAHLATGAGLRIAQREDHTSLAMTLAEQPEPDDVLVREGGAAVFLAPLAAARLTEQTLAACTKETGAAFYLRD